MVLPEEVLSQLTDEPFALAAGGTISVNLTAALSPNLEKQHAMSVFIVILDSGQVASADELLLRSEDDTWEPLVCAFPYKMRFAVNEGPISWTSQHEEVYTLALLNCMDNTVFVQGRFEFVNPDNEHLSLEDVLMVPTYSALVILYAQLTLLWIALLVKHRKQTTRLQLFLCGDLLLKTSRLLLNAVMYFTMSTEGDLSRIYLVVFRALQVVEDSSFATILLCIAMGWTITHSHLRPQASRALLGIFLLSIVLDGLQASCGSTHGDETCGLFKGTFYVLALYVLHFVTMFAVIIFMNSSLERLGSDVFSATYRRDRIIASQQYLKFLKFRVAFVGFLLAPMVDVVVQSSQTTMRHKWISAVCSELLSCFVYCSLASCLYPDKDDPAADPSSPHTNQLDDLPTEFF
eukprot:c19876_g1_i3.p1 GENE.c19876_g1_i3~~c19876_g1_i3.p1  ORF type:complete len:432 (+),score=104.80 c19876_g1_i3:83-1297(+)